MSDPEPPRLLVRERGELDAVATPLGEGRRVVAFLVCEVPLRPVVLAYLREKSGVAIPEAEAITDPWRMLEVLAEAAVLGPKEVRSIAVDHRLEDVLRTLNWHREKLRRGASVLVWIEGVEGLRALRAMAPDAYSFRDVAVILAGEEPVPVRLPEADSLEIQLARIPYEAAETPEERARAAAALGIAWQRHGSTAPLRELVLDALSKIPEEVYTDERAGLTRGALWGLLITQDALRGCLVEAWKTAQRRLASPAESHVESDFLSDTIRHASPISPLGQSAMDGVRGESQLALGELEDAEESARTAVLLGSEAHRDTVGPAYLLAQCLRQRGEIDAALRILREMAMLPTQEIMSSEAARAIAELHLDTGDVVRGLAGFHAVIHEAASSLRDGFLYDACTSYVTSLRAAHEADRLSPQDLTDADAELAHAESVALSISGTDPPWYIILFPGLRAELLSLRPDRLAEAVTLAATALDRARAVWPDAVPMHARMHAAHLVRAGRIDEALTALSVAEPEAAAQRHLRELARLQALTVAVLVRITASADEIDPRMAALRTTFDETGAPRIVADTLLELALLLPPDSRRPDPLALLDEGHALFLEMPIVAQEARCLEVMGDILAARGLPADAHRRWLAAKAILERYGLGLRLPLLSAKLDLAR